MSINGFPIQILLPKSKEERTEVISRLLSTFVTHKLQEHLNFSIHLLNFSELFQYIFIRHGVKLGPGPWNPRPQDLGTLRPGIPQKFQSGTPGPPSKCKSGAPGPPSKFTSGTPGPPPKFKSGTSSPFFNEFIFFRIFHCFFLLIYFSVFFK